MILVVELTILIASELGLAPAPSSGNIDLEAYAPAPRATSGDAPIFSPSPIGNTSLTSKNSSTPAPTARDADPSIELPKETRSKTVKWCALQDEFVNYQYYISLLSPVDDYTWKCVKKKTTSDCMEAIKMRNQT